MPDPVLVHRWLMMPSEFLAAWVACGLRIAAGEVEAGDGGTVL